MTRLLESAVERARAMPEADQDRLARLLLEELDASHEWDDRFARSPEGLATLARRAMERDARGESVVKGWDAL